MVKEQRKAPVKGQARKKPRTIEEKLAAREVYVFSKAQGTLKCKDKNLEIKSASFGATKPGDKPKHYQVPFTEAQAREICGAFNHAFSMPRGK